MRNRFARKDGITEQSGGEDVELVLYGNTMVGVLTIAVQLVEGGEEPDRWEDGEALPGAIDRVFNPAAIAVTRVVIMSEDDGGGFL